MSFISSLWFTLVGSLFVLSVSAQDFSIQDYIVSGTGCAPGSVNATISPSGENVHVRYSAFTSKAGPGYGYDDNRKNCQLTLVVGVPSGYQFGFSKFGHTGTYTLDEGVTATYRTSYYYQGALNDAKGSNVVTGPAKSDSSTLDGILTPVSWSPCGRTSLVAINTDVRVENSANSKGSGSFTLRTSPSLNFVWQKC